MIQASMLNILNFGIMIVCMIVNRFENVNRRDL